MSHPLLAPAAGRTLADVVPEVASAIGQAAVFPEHIATWQLPERRAYVIFLIDGLGDEQLVAHAEAAPFLMAHRSEPGSATVPSTTATSLTTLGTALLPGAHGVVGFTSRIPGTQRLLQALTWDKRVDPVKWQPHETAFGRLARSGVRVSVVNKREYHNSGLSVASQRGAQFVGADRPGERIAGLRAAVAEGPALAYGYDSDLDWSGHKFGVDSAQWRDQLRHLDHTVAHVREALPSDVGLLVIADHGMIDCRASDHIDIDDVAALREGIALFGGEARLRHLYCPAGAVTDVVDTWKSYLGDRAEVFTREEAIAAGWFGPVTPQVSPRLGDVLVAATGTTGIFSSKDFRYETTLVGLHGSLTSAELSIPLIVC